MPVLVLKLVLVPALIAAITLASRRLGPRLAGALTGLPVVAGPIALFIALEQGPDFAARAAVATLAGLGSLALFCVVYAHAALRAPWWTSLALAWGGFALGTLVLQALAPALPAALAIALLAPLAVRALTPRPALAPSTAPATRGDVAARMVTGAALVVGLTAAADALGPRLSGLLTVFPVATTVLAVFSHRNQGAPFAVHLLRGLAAGLYSLTAFFTTLALTLRAWGTAGSFAAATVAAVVAQAVVLRLLRR